MTPSRPTPLFPSAGVILGAPGSVGPMRTPAACSGSTFPLVVRVMTREQRRYIFTCNQ